MCIANYAACCAEVHRKVKQFFLNIQHCVSGGVSGSGSATGELGHYGSHPRPQVADRGMPSRMDKSCRTG